MKVVPEKTYSVKEAARYLGPNPTLSSSKTFVFIESLLFRVFNMLKEEALSWHMVALSQQSAEKYILFLRFFAAWLNDWGILSGRVVNYI